MGSIFLLITITTKLPLLVEHTPVRPGISTTAPPVVSVCLEGGTAVTCVSVQRWVRSRKSRGGAGRHNQTLSVARSTAENADRWRLVTPPKNFSLEKYWFGKVATSHTRKTIQISPVVSERNAESENPAVYHPYQQGSTAHWWLLHATTHTSKVNLMAGGLILQLI